MNVNAMIKRLGGKKYIVTRALADSEGAYDQTNGTYVPGDTEQLEVLGSVQPMTSDEIVSIPEGDRTRERYRFYSAAPLKNIKTVKLQKGDLVLINDEQFEVEKVDHWPNHGKAIVVRVNTNEN